MNSPNPVPPGWNPTNSTYATAIGGALATVIVGVLASFHHTLDSVTAAGLATVCGAFVGYFFNGGRK